MSCAQFCDLEAILFFGGHFVFKKIQKLFRLSIGTSMRKLDFVAQEMSELCSIWRPFCFLVAILFFEEKKCTFVQTVHINFHAKSRLCSSRNEPVMLNFASWRPFCFSKNFPNLFGLSIQTSMQNRESVAHKMSELCSI